MVSGWVITPIYSPFKVPSLKLTARTWKLMLGIRSFPLGMNYLQARTVSFRECRISIDITHLPTIDPNFAPHPSYVTQYRYPEVTPPRNRILQGGLLNPGLVLEGASCLIKYLGFLVKIPSKNTTLSEFTLADLIFQLFSCFHIFYIWSSPVCQFWLLGKSPAFYLVAVPSAS